MRAPPLRQYLNDHLAGSVFGERKARSIRDHSEPGGALALFLEQLVAEIQEERGQLRAIASTLGLAPSPLKLLGGWVTQKASLLAVNKLGLSYTPLSRFLDLEALVLGITGKAALWRMLRALTQSEPRLSRFELERLEAQALRQRDTLDRLRLEAGREAFVPEDPGETTRDGARSATS